MTKSDECREAFEKWFLGENPTITDKRAIECDAGGIYGLMTTRINWIAWQAAWQARTPSLDAERPAVTQEVVEKVREAGLEVLSDYKRHICPDQSLKRLEEALQLLPEGKP